MSEIYRYINVLVFIAIIAHLPNEAKAQSLGPYVVASTGHLLQDNSVKLYGSMGEPISTMIGNDHIMVAQGLLQSLIPEELTADCARNEGTIFFENCDNGELFFFIEMEDGTVFDPYYVPSINFDHEDGQTVEFDFVSASFDTPCSLATEAISITCVQEAFATDTEELSPESTEINVYPNPSNGDQLYVTFPKGQQVSRLDVLDILGRELITMTIETRDEQAIDVTTLGSGSYFVRLHLPTGVFIKKVVIE